MFSLERFRELNDKVKSHDDFPGFIQELKKTGIDYYEIFFEDGHADYYCTNAVKVSTSKKYDKLTIAEESDDIQFLTYLHLFCEEKSDCFEFYNNCVTVGVERRVTSIEKMTSIYYSKAGKVIFVEKIPLPQSKTSMA